jgi:hypothetical protein
MSTAVDPNEWMSQEIFKILSGLGHRVFLYNNKGQRVYDPSESNRMFSDDAKMMITLDWTKGRPRRPQVILHTSETTEPRIIDEVRSTIKKHNLYDHKISVMPYGKTLEPKNFAWMNEPVKESQWSGTTRTSRQPVGRSEVVIRHREPLLMDQGSRRWTKIASIFVHSPDGSRWKCPWKHISGAKAMAQHTNHDGLPWDNTGSCIQLMIETLIGLRKIRRWASDHDLTMLSACETLCNDIKRVLQLISHRDSYEDGISAAQQLTSSWASAVPVSLSAQFDLNETVAQALGTVFPDNTTQWPEAHSLTEWFDQFQLSFESEDQKHLDVIAAKQDTNSSDPREILQSLTRNAIGWESKFEENPMEVLQSIEDQLDRIKKIS